MPSPHREFVRQLTTWIKADVQAAAGWKFWEEPLNDYASGTNCAVWWDSDQPVDEFSTTGYLGLFDFYRIRYWEPADEGSRASVDEAAGDTLETAIQDVRRAILTNSGPFPGLPVADSGASQMVYLGARKLTEDDGASSVRGFEIVVRVTRGESYS